MYGWPKKRTTTSPCYISSQLQSQVQPLPSTSSNVFLVDPSASKSTAVTSSGTSKMKGVQGPGEVAPVRVKRPEEGPYHEEEYQEEITRYMAGMDAATVASAELMDSQPELQWFMRPYLIDFLIEVHQQFRLRPEVLYLAMNIVDRYVSKRVVYKKHYQLVGCAALWIAAKFEDGKDKVPLVRELADMCCKAYDESAFIQMEGHVLSTIQWCIGHPSAESWLRINVSGLNYEEPRVQNVARFLMEITLFHREFVGIQSSVIAKGALSLARFICGKPKKPVGPLEHGMVKVAMAIDRYFVEKLDSISEIVVRKYQPTYYSRASTLVREWYLSGRRYVFTPDPPITPMSSGLPTPGLSASSSWSSKRGSWMSGSPSAGSLSCASSDAGDESPLTPITPVHAHVADPFTTMHSKENIPPSGSSNGSVMGKGNGGGNVFQQVIRPVLHALPGVGVGELAIPTRTMRRLSN